MSESTLSLTRGNIKSAIGAYLGVSRTTGSWSTDTANDVSRIIAAGERQMYAPAIPMPNGAPAKSYVWSFLISTATVSISNATATYDLPDNFSGFITDRLAFSSVKDWPLKIVPYDELLESIQMYGTSMPSGITQPLKAAVIPKTFTATTGFRQQITMWPTPTGTLSASAPYRKMPDATSTDNDYPMGGALHAETYLESCLAKAEEFQNDQSTIHRERFAELLAASVALDSQLHPQVAAFAA